MDLGARGVVGFCIRQVGTNHRQNSTKRVDSERFQCLLRAYRPAESQLPTEPTYLHFEDDEAAGARTYLPTFSVAVSRAT